MAEWVDLIDPTPDELREKLPPKIQESALERLLAACGAKTTSRARHSRATGATSSASSSLAVAVPDEDRVFYQEVDVVITHDVLVTVSKTPPGEHPYDPRPTRESCRAGRLRRDDVLPTRRRHRRALPGPGRLAGRGDRRAGGQRGDFARCRRPAFASARSGTTFCTSAAHLPLRAMQFAAWSTTSSR